MIKKIIRTKKIWLVLGLLTGMFIVLAGCGGNQGSPTSDGNGLSGSIKIIGSNTVTPLSTVWAEDFMIMHPKISIAVSGPGSGAGIAALINGTTDICQASRNIKQSEINERKRIY